MQKAAPPPPKNSAFMLVTELKCCTTFTMFILNWNVMLHLPSRQLYCLKRPNSTFFRFYQKAIICLYFLYFSFKILLHTNYILNFDTQIVCGNFLRRIKKITLNYSKLLYFVIVQHMIQIPGLNKVGVNFNSLEWNSWFGCIEMLNLFSLKTRNKLTLFFNIK